MKLFTLFPLLILSFLSQAQTTISGVITDTDKNPLLDVNVYLDGTYDGATTDIEGKFSFTTIETGTQVLVASAVGYEEYRLEADVAAMGSLKLRFRESLNELNTVILSAGSFSAGDSSKASVLKPLDVVTTASAVGDFVGALQTLPGTTANPDDGRLFVRGGRAEETQIFIDGNRVFRPFTPTTGNLPTRGRFSPFLFDGITFSTGGYSAEYGDALSSVLLLNTTDFPEEEKTEIGIMTVGASLGNTQIWGDNSVSVNAGYINLEPYNNIIPQNNRFTDAFESLNAEAVYRHKFKKGMFKAYSAFSYNDFAIIQDDINVADGFPVAITNNNYYGNLNYLGDLSDSWKIETGLSLAHDTNDLEFGETGIDASENAIHAKLRLQKRYNNYFKFNVGAEQFLINYNEDIAFEQNNFTTGIDYGLTGTFAEAEIFASKDLAFKAGIRGDYYSANEKFKISPRLSAAFSLSESSQISLAYGNFYQIAQNNIQQYSPDLDTENAQHFIANFLYKKNNRMLRLEGYYKSYDNLITFDTAVPQFGTEFSNNGDGYASGLDIFWRDEKSVKNLDYWVSYSYLDTERLSRNFTESATPNFATDHNLSVVGKYWVDDLKSQVGLAFNYASGRPFTNANQEGFLNDKTKSFQSLDLNWAYLIDDQKILYLSVSNVLGRDNVFNYQYSNTPDAQGNFDRRAIGQAADRFFFVGFFWTIGGSDNQLDDL
ncbi:TonB-dependent receptor [Nonlabens spongiae]|uniref:TonB-dependent receptor n=1 Tax=Nonlabens spongiae TaxID=331648 RepID=A0A1W6MLU6_9FLAO|nr:TonB-dependent receptor [Nonlabens spongiae]ARN78570.1 TonB-dependent receptor [Nonlabens spongiae]